MPTNEVLISRDNRDKAMQILWRAVLHLRQSEPDVNTVGVQPNYDARTLLMDMRQKVVDEVTP